MIGTSTQRFYFMLLVFTFLLPFCYISWKSGYTLSNELWQKKAAQTECAQFHPGTGKFQWIGKFKKELEK